MSVPRMIGEFKLIEPLGSGGMGDVYLGHDTVLDRSVAIKLLRDPSGAHQGEPPTSPLLEARAAARIQHPNVATIHRVGQIAGQRFIVSELVRGRGLDALPKPMPWQEVLKLALGLSRGLAAAHRKGVLHGDIKPANAILGEDGIVKLVDFGLARLVDAESATGDEGFLAGTPNYMAPEVWLGDGITRQSDVFSMGALLYELCTGAPLFAGQKPYEISVQAMRGAIAPIATVVENIDPRFAEILDRCLRRSPAERYASAEELLDALERLEASAGEGVVPEGNPYRGLLAFEAAHRAVFFGRDSEVGTLLERLRFEGFVLVAGDSGSGKSSLCRAGVLPRVSDGALDRNRTYKVVELVPGRRPLASIAAALATALARSPQEIAEAVRSDPEWLRRTMAEIVGPHAGLLVFVDQLEELLTLGDPEETAAVAEALGRLAIRSPGVRLLASIRGDFLARATALPGLGDELHHALYLLRPLTPEKLRHVIVGPARAKGTTFESDQLVDTLVTATVRAEGGLPLLQFALSELWDAKAPGSSVITAQSLVEIGGVEGALARHADHVLNVLPAAQQAAARRMLSALVTLARTRARRTEQELIGADPSAKLALDALVRGRLLVATEAAGGTAVEIAHEALVSSWFTLRRILDEDAEARVVRDRLETAAADWKRLGKSRDALWGRLQLAEARRLEGELIGEQERAFLEASTRKLTSERRLRRSALLAIPVAAGLVYGIAQYRARREVNARLDGYRNEASQMLSEAERLKKEHEDNEQRAFAAFDQQAKDEGERRWREAREQAGAIDTLYREAAQRIETALALDGEREDVREDLARALYLRILHAEHTHHAALGAELAERLQVYDARGQFRSALAVRAEIHVETRPQGAEVTLEPYSMERDGPAVLGTPRALGAAPCDAADLPAGSYLLTLRAAGRPDVRYPVSLRRGERLPLDIYLPAASEIPSGFLYVAKGRFRFGSSEEEMMRKSFLATVPTHDVMTDAFLISRHETTFEEWIRFLKTLPQAERKARMPRAVEGDLTGTVRLTEREDGSFDLEIKPSTVTLSAKMGQPIVYTSRGAARTQDWLRMPVMGILAEDAQAYLGWLDRTGQVKGARFCTDHEWERAARGADERLYPHGDALLPEDANYYDSYGKDPAAVGPDEVGSHPRSRSPFGAEDMAGNVFEWVRSSLAPNEWTIRGGSYFFDTVSARSPNRTPIDQSYRDSRLGVRVCAPLSVIDTRQ